MDKSFSFGDFATFEKLIAPKVVIVVYWLGLIGIGLSALIGLMSALAMMQYSPAAGLGTILLVLIGTALGTLLWRVVMEVYMVFFGIYDRLGDIRADLAKKTD